MSVDGMFHVKQLIPSFDWLTVTTRDDMTGIDLRILAGDFKKTHIGREMQWTDMRLMGYEGEGCSSLFWGYSARSGYILQARGGVADMYAARVSPAKSNVTRLDLAVTVHLEKPILHLASKHYNKLLEKKITARKNTVITNSAGGNTLYVGSRSSSQMGRVYDKSAQQGNEPGYVWRYEVEVKKPRASLVFERLYEKMRLGGITEETRQIISGWVYDWFLNRGVNPIWRRNGTSGLGEIEVGCAVTDAQRKIEWIRTQVRPSVNFLIGIGLKEELYEALGLDYEQGELF